MQQSIHDFQNLKKEKNISVSNEYLKEILYQFDFIFYPDIHHTEKTVKQYENNSKIIIIDECIEDGIKYYVVCFDYKLIILPQEDDTDNLILSSIFARFEDIDKYFILKTMQRIKTFSMKKEIFQKNFQFQIKICSSFGALLSIA